VQIKNREKTLIIATIAVVGLYIANLAILTPLQNAWKARSDQIAKLRKDLDNGRKMIQRQASIRSQWGRLRDSTLTNETSGAEQQVYNAINRWSQESGATVNAITPQWKHDAEDYMSYESRLDVSGDMNSLIRFVYNIENEPMALKLESVELSTRDKEGQQLTLAVQVNGLVLTPTPQAK
jgi:Tfp pilus assembly protein PilO